MARTNHILWGTTFAFSLVFAATWLLRMVFMMYPKLGRALRRRPSPGAHHAPPPGNSSGSRVVVSAVGSESDTASTSSGSGLALEDLKPNAAGEHHVTLPCLAVHQLHLQWRDLSCSYQTSAGKKPVLQNVSGQAHPWEMLALLGPSGAGKSTLLDILAERKTTGQLGGSVLVNGVARGSGYRRKTAYVPQTDNFLPTLTVGETASYYATLLLPSSWGKAQRRSRVAAVLAEMGLSKTSDTLVGGTLPGGLALRGLSGGERKRLSIAVGIVAAPSIIFLDEPTSGLDSFAALSVMGYMRNMAHVSGHTVIASIHQPRAAIWAMFDKTLVLASGLLMYYGPRDDLVAWFQHLGYAYDGARHGVPSDWAMDLVNVGFHKPQEVYGRAINSLEDLREAADAFRQHYLATSARNQGAGGAAGATGKDVQAVGSAFAAVAGTAGSAAGTAGAANKDVDVEDAAGVAGRVVVPRGDSPMEQYAPVAGMQRPAAQQQAEGNKDPSFLPPAASLGSSLDGSVDEPVGNWWARLSLPQLCGGGGSGDRAEDKVHSASWGQQFRVLLWREVTSATRNPADVAGRMLVFSGVAVFYGLVFYNLGTSLDGLRNRLNTLFMLPGLLLLLPYVYISLYTNDKQCFMADASARLYKTSAFYAAKVLAVLPFAVLNSLVLGLILWGLAGLNSAAWAVASMGLFTVLTYLVAQQVLALAAVVMPNQDVAFVVAIAWTALNFVMCNFTIRYKDMEQYWISYLRYVSAMGYAFDAYVTIEFAHATYSCASGLSPDTLNLLPALVPSRAKSLGALLPTLSSPGPDCVTDATALLGYFDISRPVWQTGCILLGYLLGLHVLTYVGYLRLTNKERR